MKSRKAGFTLVELVVAMMCTSIVFMAADTFLLSCQRIGLAAMKTSSQEEKVSMAAAALQIVVEEGGVHADGDKLLNSEEREIPLPEGITILKIIPEEENPHLLTVSFKADEQKYVMKACRRVTEDPPSD